MDSLPAGVKRILDTSNNSLVSLLFRGKRKDERVSAHVLIASINPTGTLSLHRTTTSRLSTKVREESNNNYLTSLYRDKSKKEERGSLWQPLPSALNLRCIQLNINSSYQLIELTDCTND